MAHPQNPLRLNVGFIIYKPVGTNREFEFELPSLELEYDLSLFNFSGIARIDHVTQGLFVQGRFNANLEEQCVRCLENFPQPIQAEFSELFSFKNQLTTDSGLILPDDGNINLAPLVWEYFTLDIPMKPLCRQDCKGLCPVCGANLNLGLCKHQQALENQIIPVTSDNQ